MRRHSIILVITGLIFYASSLVNGEFTCDPEADCNGASAGDMVPDPYDCEKYYICIELPDGTIRSSTSPLNCQSGFYYNQTLKACSQETVPGICQNECDRICEVECPSPSEVPTYVANRNNCSTYFGCYGSEILEIPCIAETPYFNGDKCVKYESQCCNFCTPYCSQLNTEIQDPCNCSAFYICVEVGTPSESSRGTCEAGYYFDEAAIGCVEGSCKSQCSSTQCGLVGRTLF